MTTPEISPARPLSIQEWDSLIEDFHYGEDRRERWTSLSTIDSLTDSALACLLKKDFPTQSKLSLLVFLDEFSTTFFNELSSDSLDGLVEVLRAIVQSPTDTSHGLKEQAMVSCTTILIALDFFHIHHVESVVDLLLALVNRPNHGFDRQARAVACECLRQLEKAFPGLLSEVAGHIWALCQAERTHAAQSYLLLFTTIVHNVANQKLSPSLLSTSSSLVPFCVPNWIRDPGSGAGSGSGSGPNQKELRRALSFLLEWPQVFTSCAMMEFMSMVMPLALALELQSSMLRVQFFGMIYSFDPMLCHVVLLMCSQLPDAFDEQETEVVRRLMLLSKETQIYLVFRLLALHWLMGLLNKILLSGVAEKRNSIIGMIRKFYPAVFDPLALKALKLDLLARCAVSSDFFTGDSDGKTVVRLFEDGLVSVAGFKWLPPWSSETAVAFRTFHKFLIGASSHSDADPSSTRILMESTIFQTLQGLLVEMSLAHYHLVPVIISLSDRLLGCSKHCWLGERLLQTFDKQLLSTVKINSRLASYFPLFHRLAANDSIPPRQLIELLTKFVSSLVEKRGPDTGLKLWSLGSDVLGICRTMMMHHHSSRLFLGLSRLLTFTCLYYPDLEVRDHARTSLRMLVCVPGRKIRSILKPADGISPSANPTTFYNVQSPRYRHDPKKSLTVSSYIHLERVRPPIVQQSWSLTLSSLGVETNEAQSLGGIKEREVQVDEVEIDTDQNTQSDPVTERINPATQTLRVMDSKISEILATLRRYFALVPDFRYMPGLKVRIQCTLRFDSKPYSSIWGGNSPNSSSEEIYSAPAIYATVLKFSSSAPYGTIPPCRIPFLIGSGYQKQDNVSGQEVSLDIVPIEDPSEEEDEGLRAPVLIELEPREPSPGLVTVSIEANTENGQIIQGKLESVPVGIEDMFLQAIIPSDIVEDEIPNYYFDLFTALWEACGTNTGRETFVLKGGKGVSAISGTRSVKLLEVYADTLVQAIERHLAPFVVSVSGEQLINVVKDGGVIRNALWKDEMEDSAAESGDSSVSDFGKGPLRLTYMGYGDEMEIPVSVSKRNLGLINILIFLPPRFHLLFQMEVGEFSSLVRIRTDHWPCLAYVDDYLEALFL